MQQTFVRLLALLILLSASIAAPAAVRLPAIISDNMVLQQQTKVRIWGNANPGERVIVTLQQKSANAVADKQGRWETFLNTGKAGGPFELTVKGDNLITIKSPMIGTFYRRPSPDKPIFAEVGDEIAPGKVLCIIEAMKLFNEIESEVKGKIVKVLAEDASPVEYDQPLFLVEPA